VNTGDEQRLQDYLDGRLSASERSEFEARLKADADLAGKARAAMALRQALQADAPELPPGFYARARDRFERTGPVAGHRWFRLLSWESAGLAAAVVLVAVLFVPPLMQQDGPLRDELVAPGLRPPAPAQKESISDRRQPSAEDLKPKDEPEEQPRRSEESNLSAAAADSERRDELLDAVEEAEELGKSDEVLKRAEGFEERRAPEEADDLDAGRAAPDLSAVQPVPAPPKGERGAGSGPAEALPEYGLDEQSARSASGQREKKRSAPESYTRERTVERAQRASESDAAIAEGDPHVAGAESAEAEEVSPVIRVGDYSPEPAPAEPHAVRILEATELRPGAVRPGTVKVVETEQGWNEAVAQSDVRSFGSLAYDPGRRIVLIGPRAVPIGCSPITARLAGDRVEIHLPSPGIDGRPAGGGCAVYLPRTVPAAVVVRDPS
jgi:hypothetical protein